MNKKGQYYIFTVMILLGLVYVLVSKQAEVELPKQSPKLLFENFEREVPYFVNNAILNNDESITRNFTEQFIAFAKERGITFEMTHVFASYDEAIVFTTAEDVSAETGGDETYNLTKNGYVSVGKVSFINITMDEKKYEFSISYPSYSAVLVSRKGFNKDVFIYG